MPVLCSLVVVVVRGEHKSNVALDEDEGVGKPSTLSAECDLSFSISLSSATALPLPLSTLPLLPLYTSTSFAAEFSAGGSCDEAGTAPEPEPEPKVWPSKTISSSDSSSLGGGEGPRMAIASGNPAGMAQCQLCISSGPSVQWRSR